MASEKRREQTREAVRRHRAKKGTTVDKLAAEVQNAADLPDPPSRDFLLRALGVQARDGNVAAIRILLEEYRRDDAETPAEPARSAIDELGARRTGRIG